MSKETKLLPCPFCGGKEIEYDNCDRGTGQWYECIKCGIQLMVGYGDDLQKAWNKRSDTNVVSSRYPDVAEAIGEIDKFIQREREYQNGGNFTMFNETFIRDITKIKKLLEVKTND